uniref:Uncharacterized protein n=1 Tax=Candidatus Kentrum sp. LFY TaxID=2126342 RepID=A0A450X8S6_9GAMM|nr:MAG: hypothetical protein BECKLFY1418C_GA0070996_12742 [Candidatus Kentron sp. LFY]VFK26413.1 MAG: hypothetical protein BECKLFY1418C_GA0070996_13431 [Candidatus Kentron sp. LFY]
MELEPLYRCVAALDVHQAKPTGYVVYEDEAGEPRMELREFGSFKRDRKAMAESDWRWWSVIFTENRRER